MTLSFVTTPEQVLLLRVAAHKDRFAGCWNGVGGHVHEGENIRAAALREIREETGLVLRAAELRAVVQEVGLLGKAHLLFVFRAGMDHPREPVPGGEGALAWFDRAALPWADLVPDLRQLLPAVLESSSPLLFGVQRFDGGDRAVRLDLE